MSETMAWELARDKYIVAAQRKTAAFNNLFHAQIDADAASQARDEAWEAFALEERKVHGDLS